MTIIRSPLAIATGLAASGGALAILLHDPISSGQWRLDHGLLPIVVAITIAAGHLLGTAARSRKPVSALGFAAVFAVGTVLTVYSSVGSQKASGSDKASAVEAHNAAVAAQQAAIVGKRRERDLAADMLKGAQARLLAECGTGKGSKCAGVQATVSVYDGAVKGHDATVRQMEADLARMGGVRVARPKARAFGEAAAIFGFDAAKVEAGATVLEPFAFSLLLELAAIVAFGFGFQHSQRVPSIVPANSNLPVPPVPPRGRDDDVIDWVREFRRFHGRDPQIPEVQRQFRGTPKTTAWRRIKAA
jgi:hypothetical protein